MDKLFVFQCKVSFFFENFLYNLFTKKRNYYYYTSRRNKKYRYSKEGGWEVYCLRGIMIKSLFRRTRVAEKMGWKAVSNFFIKILDERMMKDLLR